MPDRFAFLRRPASLSARVTGLVGIAMMVVLLLFSWVSVGSSTGISPKWMRKSWA